MSYQEEIPPVLLPHDKALHLSDMGFEFMGQILTKRTYMYRIKYADKVVAVNVMLTAEGNLEQLPLSRIVRDFRTKENITTKVSVLTPTAFWNQLAAWEFSPVTPYCRADKIDSLLT